MGVAFSPSGEFFSSVGADEQVSQSIGQQLLSCEEHLYKYMYIIYTHIYVIIFAG